MPEDQAWSDAGVSRIEVELLRQRPVIAALRFLEAMEMLLEILLFPERRRVDALQHLPMFVAAPIRAGSMQQFEILEIRSVRNVRSFTQIDERPVGVSGDDLVVGEFAEAFQLQRIV